MKTPMTFILCAMMTSSVLADTTTTTTTQNYSKGAKCETELTTVTKPERLKANEAGLIQVLADCENYKILSIMNGNEDITANANVTTMDGKIPCRQDGGFTMDYKDCKRVMNYYNAVIMAETAMFATQKIILNESNLKQQKDIAAATAKGDLQYGAIEAVIARNDLNAKMYKTQAITYSGAVAALSGGLMAWGGKKSLARMCKKNIANITELVATDVLYKDSKTAIAGGEFNLPTCEKIANQYKDKQAVFANENSKIRFISELAIYTQKAAEAIRLAGISAAVGKRDPKDIGKGDTVTDAFDPCMGPNPPTDCKTNNNHNITPGSFAGATTGFGTGGGANQDFNFDPDATSGLPDDAATTAGADSGSVADMSSPFEQAAKDANGIFDQAGKAVSTPGGGGQQGGAGGGPGIGGGGSASLSDDPGVGAEDGGETDIKTNKVSGKYKAGGGGYGAVKGSKDDANPFASMFDAKGEAGGVEEDRSIASDDGEGSGLFHKISKKYGQVQQEKRLDSQNLE